MMPRAVTLTQGSALVIVDYRKAIKRSGPAGADGICTATFDPVPAGYLWRVERIVVTNTSTISQSAARFYDTDPNTPGALADSTFSGNEDIADENSPVTVDSNVSAVMVWTGCDVAAVGTVKIQYVLVQRTAG